MEELHADARHRFALAGIDERYLPDLAAASADMRAAWRKMKAGVFLPVRGNRERLLVIQIPNADFANLWRTVGKALARLHELERPKRGKPRLVWPPAAAMRAEPEIEGLKGLIRLRGWDIYLAAGPRGVSEAFSHILDERPELGAVGLDHLAGAVGAHRRSCAADAAPIARPLAASCLSRPYPANRASIVRSFCA